MITKSVVCLLEDKERVLYAWLKREYVQSPQIRILGKEKSAMDCLIGIFKLPGCTSC